MNNPELEKKLLEETKVNYDKMIFIQQNADFEFKMMCDLFAKSNDNMSYDEREAFVKQCETLLARVNISINVLKQLEVEWSDLCKRVNTYYGKELLKPRPKIDWDSILGNLDDETDWWKKE